VTGAAVKRILLINLHSSRNAGDAALTRVGIEQLQAAFPEAEITLAMNDPASHDGNESVVASFMTWVKPLDRVAWPRSLWPIVMGWMLLRCWLAAQLYRLTGTPRGWLVNTDEQALLTAYMHSDLVVSCAGNFLYSSGRFGVSFMISVFSIAYAHWVNKPIYTLPQSIGPLRHGWERMLVRRVYSRARLVVARERVSFELAQALRLPPDRCFCLPDIAFGLMPDSPSTAKQYLLDHGVAIGMRPLLGVTVINWAAQNRTFARQAQYEVAVADALRGFIDRHAGQVVFFAQVTGPTSAEDDRVVARRVRDRLGDRPGAVVVIEEICTAQQLKALYGFMDFFMGTRMHSNIFALSQGVPVLAIEYFHKTSGIMQWFDLQKWVVDIRTLNSAQLDRALEEAWEQREAIHHQISVQLPVIVQQSQMAGALIAQFQARI
jgi:colanic acid/amylovoran biosynthesis protein